MDTSFMDRKRIELVTGGHTILDAEDYPEANRWTWRDDGRGYVRRSHRINGRSVTTYMHREVMKCPPGMTVDHINGDKKDNRKSNLRICTLHENIFNGRLRKNNTTGYKGVTKTRGKYQVSINCKHVGFFKTAEEAARAYDARARELHGKFAVLNFPD